jgi:hypothetical protein
VNRTTSSGRTTPWPTTGPRPLGPINPFELYLMLAATLQGFTVLAHLARPSSIEALLPRWLVILWAGLLVVGGILTGAGLTWPGDPFTAIEIKRVGLVASGIGASAYAVALFEIGPGGIVAGLYAAGFVAACAVRVWQIRRALRAARAYLAEVRQHRTRRE